jgi:tetratricopeptide (TPR) repeat protein
LSASDVAAARYRSALGRILRVQSGAGQLVAEAVTLDPGFALGHAVRALLAAEDATDVNVQAALEAAQAPDARADERERRFVEVAAARITDPGPGSAAALLAYIDAYPEDALAVSLAVPTIAFSGATEVPSEAWALIDALAPAYGSHWWYRGMLAFSRQEQGRFAEAAELADRALGDEPAAGHAAHAKAHVHYETGDHRAGLSWLSRWIVDSGPQAAQRAHFSWHAAIHELALGDYEALARRYATQLAPPAVRGVRALIDSGSLLWKARVGGLPAGPSGVEAVLQTVPDRLLAEPPTPFLALHVAVTLAAANDCRGLSRLRRYAESSDTPAFFATVAPLAEALIDVLHGDFEVATNALLALDAEGVDVLGGSAAQREIVEDTLVYTAIQAGRYDLAFSALERRLDRRESPHDRSRRRVLARQLMRSRATGAADLPG